MCACEGLYVCDRCEGTRDEPGYQEWLDVDENMPLEAPESRSDALGWFGP